MFAARLLSHRHTLFVIALIVLTLVILLMLKEEQVFLGEHSLEALKLLKKQEESIAILLIGYGVLLEGRTTLLQLGYPDQKIQHSEMSWHCKSYGYMLISLGLLTEIADQCIKYVTDVDTAMWLERIINYPINFYSVFLVLVTLTVLSKGALDSQPAQLSVG